MSDELNIRQERLARAMETPRVTTQRQAGIEIAGYRHDSSVTRVLKSEKVARRRREIRKERSDYGRGLEAKAEKWLRVTDEELAEVPVAQRLALGLQARKLARDLADPEGEDAHDRANHMQHLMEYLILAIEVGGRLHRRYGRERFAEVIAHRREALEARAQRDGFTPAERPGEGIGTSLQLHAGDDLEGPIRVVRRRPYRAIGPPGRTAEENRPDDVEIDG